MQPNAHQLATALAHRQYLKEQLLVRFPTLAEDEQALADTLDGETDLKEMLAEVMRSTEEDAMLVAGIAERVAELTERKGRLEHRIKAKREAICLTMDKADLGKIEAPEFTLSLRRSPASVVITDQALLPAEYLRTPEPPAPEPDKKKIGDALKANTSIPGAVLSNGGVSLTVRKK